MPKRDALPQHVLSEALIDAIGDRRIRAAVFVSFQLDAQFFEDAILPPLLGRETGSNPRITRMLVQDALRELDEVVVLYDRSALDADGPARQAVRYVPVTWNRHFAFHAKHALLLVADAEGRQALVLLTTSANLTENGWWRNVEVADIQVIEGHSSLRQDLLGDEGLLAVLRHLDRRDVQPALDGITRFLTDEVEDAPEGPRLYVGATDLPTFLRARLPGVRPSRLELLAPFVDDRDAAPIKKLHDVLAPKEIWVWYPWARDGQTAASADWAAAVEAIPGARFAKLRGIDRSLGKAATEERFVHAKVFRIVDGDGKRCWLLAGSPNLTGAAFAGRAAGNFETALLQEADPREHWLEPVDEPPPPRDEALTPPEESRPRPLPLRIRFDWTDRSAWYLWEVNPPAAPIGIGRLQATAEAFTFDVGFREAWTPLSDAIASWLAEELLTGNIVQVRSGAEDPALVLVEEEGHLSRPDLVSRQLTPADILQYWTLVDATRREEKLRELLARVGSLDPHDPVAAVLRAEEAPSTMFDTYAGLFHAFHCLRQRLLEALERGRTGTVVARLLGHGHDALPTLLDRVFDDGDSPTEPEPIEIVHRILVLQCARDVVCTIEKRAPDLLRSHDAERSALEIQLRRLDELWDRAGLGDDQIEARAFREWFEQMWAAPVRRNA